MRPLRTMPSLNPSPPERPAIHTLALVLHAICGGIGLIATLFLAFLAASGSAVSTLVGIASQEEDAIPVSIALIIITAALLFGAISSFVSVSLAWKASQMKRFWIWALMIWSIIHVSSGCGIVLTILTVVGGFQALEAERESHEPQPAV